MDKLSLLSIIIHILNFICTEKEGAAPNSLEKSFLRKETSLNPFMLSQPNEQLVLHTQRINQCLSQL